MEHIVYLNPNSQEEEKLFNQTKSMIIRDGKRESILQGAVKKGDKLYFFNNFTNCYVQSEADVISVIYFKKVVNKTGLFELLENNQAKLQLSSEQFVSYKENSDAVLIELNFKRINSLKIKKEKLKNRSWIIADKFCNFISS